MLCPFEVQNLCFVKTTAVHEELVQDGVWHCQAAPRLTTEDAPKLLGCKKVLVFCYYVAWIWLDLISIDLEWISRARSGLSSKIDSASLAGLLGFTQLISPFMNT